MCIHLLGLSYRFDKRMPYVELCCSRVTAVSHTVRSSTASAASFWSAQWLHFPATEKQVPSVSWHVRCLPQSLLGHMWAWELHGPPDTEKSFSLGQPASEGNVSDCQ